ncbi:MAG: tRNA pseudouridine(55) synthase TruB [Clostridia bacterium]|nr:tRNA pseudouridine(55) synthase TruB [Clostridia bacterium]
MRNGLIIINKPSGITSHKAVSLVKHLLGAKKAGHTGTLDPMATGVLPVLIERGVKASEYMVSDDKHYRATLLLGITTDTEDISGKAISSSEEIPQDSEVFAAIYSMLGKSLQTPPMYSAIKQGGKKLYELARQGEVVEREKREIYVYEIKAEKINEKEYYLDVKCSKGTYIRTLCADIGKKLGCGAVMKTLERVEAGGFTIEDSITIEELEKLSPEKREERVLPVESIFKDTPRVNLPDFFARLASCGVEIYLKKINVSLEAGERVTLFNKNGFFALGEVREFEDGLAIKSIKQFEI